MTSTTLVQKLRLGLTSRSRLKLRSNDELAPPVHQQIGRGRLHRFLRTLRRSCRRRQKQREQDRQPGRTSARCEKATAPLL